MKNTILAVMLFLSLLLTSCAFSNRSYLDDNKYGLNKFWRDDTKNDDNEKNSNSSSSINETAASYEQTKDTDLPIEECLYVEYEGIFEWYIIKNMNFHINNLSKKYDISNLRDITIYLYDLASGELIYQATSVDRNVVIAPGNYTLITTPIPYRTSSDPDVIFITDDIKSISPDSTYACITCTFDYDLCGGESCERCAKYQQHLEEVAESIEGGGNSDNHSSTCRACNGTGLIECIVCKGKGIQKNGNLEKICIYCQGAGSKLCTACGGNG